MLYTRCIQNKYITSSLSAPEEIEVTEAYGSNTESGTVKKGECWSGKYYTVCLYDYLYIKYTRNANEGADHILTVKLPEEKIMEIHQTLSTFNTNSANWARTSLKVTDEELPNIPNDLYSPPNFRLSTWGHTTSYSQAVLKGKILYTTVQQNGTVVYTLQVFFLL